MTVDKLEQLGEKLGCVLGQMVNLHRAAIKCVEAERDHFRSENERLRKALGNILTYAHKTDFVTREASKAIDAARQVGGGERG